MPKRTNIQFILVIGALAAMLATSASAEVTRTEDGPPGYYSVGEWSGRCVRDGWLNGAEHESCGAQLKSWVTVDLRRTVKGLTATLHNQGCRKGTVSAKMTAKALAATNRAELLEKQIQKLIKRQQKICGLEGEMYPVEQADLTDILNENRRVGVLS
jgi:hypothetical protein